MDWFLHTLLASIGKYVASHFPQTEEAALQIALKYDLIYAQSGYVYTILPDLPKPDGPNGSGTSHSSDGIIGALSHTSAQPLPGHGFPPGASPSSTFSPPSSMYSGYGMPSPFAHPTPYPYPQPGVPAPPAFGPPTPLLSPPAQPHLLPPLGQVFAQQGATNSLPSQRKRRGNQN